MIILYHIICTWNTGDGYLIDQNLQYVRVHTQTNLMCKVNDVVDHTLDGYHF